MDELIMMMLSEIHPANFQLSFEELCLSANVSQQTMLAFVQHDIAVPIVGAQPQQWRFHVTCVKKVQKAARLYSDLDIDWADLYLVLNLLDDIEQLKNENEQLKQRLARFVGSKDN
jgi:chaperone modulatory protein CbpM